MGKHPENDREMSVIDHFKELRQRLLWCILVFLICFLACYTFAQDIYYFLAQPLEEGLKKYTSEPNMIYTVLWEVFFTEIKVSLFAAFLISFPIILLQIWKFIAPGLYKNERNAFIPFLIVSPILFFAGASLFYFVVMPLAWDFFLSFQTSPNSESLQIILQAKVADYLSLVMKLIFAFGLAFQLPVCLTLLTKAGLISATTLAKKRKYAVVFIVIAAAILTPPDVISQIGLSIPIYILYEVSIFCARIAEKKKKTSN